MKEIIKSMLMRFVVGLVGIIIISYILTTSGIYWADWQEFK